MNLLFSLNYIFLISFLQKFFGEYDLTMPVWFLWLIPMFWFFIIPITSIFYLIVMIITMLCLKIDRPFNILKKSIVKFSFFGFLTDLFIVHFLYVLYLLIELDDKSGITLKSLYGNIFENKGMLFAMCLAILISRFINYKLNRKYTFSKLDIEEENKRKLALVLAILTAPYIFFFSINI